MNRWKKGEAALASAADLADSDPDSLYVLESVAASDADAAVALAAKLIDAAEQMLPHLGIFGTGR